MFIHPPSQFHRDPIAADVSDDDQPMISSGPGAAGHPPSLPEPVLTPDGRWRFPLAEERERTFHPLLEAARGAQKEFRCSRRARRIKVGAWLGLLVLSLSPLAGAVAFPDQVVAAMPATIGAYRWAGRDVNIYGIEIRNVDLQHLIVDGKTVIAVKGDLTNVTSGIRKMPWLRFALRSKDNAEVYHWTLDTEVRPLKPGESTSFVTRLASPPETARNLEIRFAHADEIGSNTAHE